MPGDTKPFCWQCGKPLSQTLEGEPRFTLVRVGEQDVRVHKICRQDAIDYQRFDSTPRCVASYSRMIFFEAQ